MSLRIINQQQVQQLMTPAQCVPVMDEVLRAVSRGACHNPLRQILWIPDRRGALGMMPSYWDDKRYIGLKAVTYFPGNEGSDVDTHQGAVLLYEAEQGGLTAVIDGTAITAIRTAAVSAAATSALAREDARHLAMIGSGVQAGTHLDAICSVRPIDRVTVFSKSYAQAERFAARAKGAGGIGATAVRTCREAVEQADIVCTVTSARAPVVMGEWLPEGVHINAVGSSTPQNRELDAEAVLRCRLFVDRRESALNEAGEFVLAREEGRVAEGHILGEIGEVLDGRVVGRREPSDRTLFKSVGMACEDLAAALFVLLRAEAEGVGMELPFGGARVVD